ncbi:lariat debranching enzyme [Mortierella antarctica]|nr:lariat debranching enzyme [Mortierella antarctica]
MRIAVEGCCHGELDAIYKAIHDRERQNGYKVDLLLICGDFQSIRNEADLDTIACPRKYLRLGTFHKYYSGECKVPIPTVFIGGNHEASNYLWELYHGGWVCPGIYFLGFGGVINVGGLRISGMSGIYKSGHYQSGHYETFPLNDNHKRSIYHVRKYDVYKMLQVKEPMDIFLSHDWPLGIEQFGDVQWLLRKKKFFKDEIRDNTLGSLAYEHVLTSLKPAHWFSAHLHVRFTAVVQWNNAINAQDTSMAQSAAVISKPVAAQELRNPDEIDISLDDEDEDEETKPTEGDQKNDVAAVSSNPDEIQIDMDDESEGEADAGSTVAAPQQQQPIVPKTPSKAYPTSTKFLALDKCLEQREFLEILDFPEAMGPVEFKYDEEWLAIVRTLDPFLSLESRQRPPLEGERLQHTLEVNREWVRNNITLRRGLGIPENFEPTAPAHDPVRTMGHQEKQNCIAPFVNPQTEEFCAMLQIPNKINPNGRRAASAVQEVEVEAEAEQEAIASIHTRNPAEVEGAPAEEEEVAAEVLENLERTRGATTTIGRMTTTYHSQGGHEASAFRGMTKPFRGIERKQSGQSSGNYSRRGRWTETPQKHVQSNLRSGQLPKRPLSGRQKDKKFVKAARAGSHSEDDSGDVVTGYNYENDEGIDSDEASEEEYLMQGFDWSEADQDPDQKTS